MKKLLLALTTAALALNLTTGVQAAEKVLPDTNQISPHAHLEYIGFGDSAHSVWVVDNPTLHNEQELTTGTYVTHLDEATGELSVSRDGEKISSYTPAAPAQPPKN